MAYAFLKAQGKEVGKSLCEDKQVQLATKILKGAAARNVKLLLPVDHVVASGLEDSAGATTTAGRIFPRARWVWISGRRPSPSMARRWRGRRRFSGTGPWGFSSRRLLRRERSKWPKKIRGLKRQEACRRRGFRRRHLGIGLRSPVRFREYRWWGDSRVPRRERAARPKGS